MTRWKYITEAQERVARESRPATPTRDELLDIYEVISGSAASQDGSVLDVPPGSFVRLLEEGSREPWAYLSVDLVLCMNSRKVGLKNGSPVAVLPKNYREVADA